MSTRRQIDLDDIWKEVNSPNFVGAIPTNEYDHKTVAELALILQQGRNILRNPIGLNQSQIDYLTARLRQVRAEIRRQAPLVRNLSE